MSLFVGNIPLRAPCSELRCLFKRFGNCRVDIKRGFAFVDFHIADEAHSAIQALDGATLEGQRLQVRWSRPAKKKSSKGEGDAISDATHTDSEGLDGGKHGAWAWDGGPERRMEHGDRARQPRDMDYSHGASEDMKRRRLSDSAIGRSMSDYDARDDRSHRMHERPSFDRRDYDEGHQEDAPHGYSDYDPNLNGSRAYVTADLSERLRGRVGTMPDEPEGDRNMERDRPMYDDYNMPSDLAERPLSRKRSRDDNAMSASPVRANRRKIVASGDSRKSYKVFRPRETYLTPAMNPWDSYANDLEAAPQPPTGTWLEHGAPWHENTPFLVRNELHRNGTIPGHSDREPAERGPKQTPPQPRRRMTEEPSTSRHGERESHRAQAHEAPGPADRQQKRLDGSQHAQNDRSRPGSTTPSVPKRRESMADLLGMSREQLRDRVRSSGKWDEVVMKKFKKQQLIDVLLSPGNY